MTKREEPPFVSDEQIEQMQQSIVERYGDHRNTFLVGAMMVRDLCQAELSRLRTEQEGKWIRCEDRMPEQYVAVLTVTPEEDDHICVAYLERDGTWTRVDHAEKAEYPVTHWMPLPEPPSI